jgi:hypothetical protein
MVVDSGDIGGEDGNDSAWMDGPTGWTPAGEVNTREDGEL